MQPLYHSIHETVIQSQPILFILSNKTTTHYVMNTTASNKKWVLHSSGGEGRGAGDIKGTLQTHQRHDISSKVTTSTPQCNHKKKIRKRKERPQLQAKADLITYSGVIKVMVTKTKKGAKLERSHASVKTYQSSWKAHTQGKKSIKNKIVTKEQNFFKIIYGCTCVFWIFQLNYRSYVKQSHLAQLSIYVYPGFGKSGRKRELKTH